MTNDIEFDKENSMQTIADVINSKLAVFRKNDDDEESDLLFYERKNHGYEVYSWPIVERNYRSSLFRKKEFHIESWISISYRLDHTFSVFMHQSTLNDLTGHVEQAVDEMESKLRLKAAIEIGCLNDRALEEQAIDVILVRSFSK